MASGQPVWKSILQAADELSGVKGHNINRSQLVETRGDIVGSNKQTTVNAIFQIMAIATPTPPSSRVGRVVSTVLVACVVQHGALVCIKMPNVSLTARDSVQR